VKEAVKMASKEKNKTLKKTYIIAIISFFIVTLILGIKATYAYYHDNLPLSILASLVGDFDDGDGDINMVMYKENDNGVYVKTYSIPALGYNFKDSLTNCTVRTCVNGSSGDCHYSYNTGDKKVSLTSNQKVTCKFYFEKAYSSDIDVYILIEDDNGTYTNANNNKKYSMIDNIPAYGYAYVNGVCDSSAESISYDSETKKFNIRTKTKNSCYAYFDSVGESDITVNVYVQDKSDSSSYPKVETIPSGNTYVISSNRASSCTGDGVPTYTDGYINIAASSKQTCDVYLDLSE